MTISLKQESEIWRVSKMAWCERYEVKFDSTYRFLSWQVYDKLKGGVICSYNNKDRAERKCEFMNRTEERKKEDLKKEQQTMNKDQNIKLVGSYQNVKVYLYGDNVIMVSINKSGRSIDIWCCDTREGLQETERQFIERAFIQDIFANLI